MDLTKINHHEPPPVAHPEPPLPHHQPTSYTRVTYLYSTHICANWGFFLVGCRWLPQSRNATNSFMATCLKYVRAWANRVLLGAGRPPQCVLLRSIRLEEWANRTIKDWKWNCERPNCWRERAEEKRKSRKYQENPSRQEKDNRVRTGTKLKRGTDVASL